MTRNRKAKQVTRAKAQTEGVSYTAALHSQPDIMFGPPSLIAGQDQDRTFGLSAGLRFENRNRIMSLWWPVASYAAKDYAAYLRENRLGDGRLVDRMLALRDPVMAIKRASATVADLAAIASSGDLPARSAKDRPIWLAGAVLDAEGANAVAILSKEGASTLWDELWDAKQDGYDPAVHLLGTWLQDANALHQYHLGIPLQFLGNREPIIERDIETAGADRETLTEVIADAFGLLTDWDLNLSATPDGDLRTIDDIAADPWAQEMFRLPDEQLVTNSQTEDSNPLPPRRLLPQRDAADTDFGTGRKTATAVGVDPYQRLVDLLADRGIAADPGVLRARCTPRIQAWADEQGIPLGLAEQQFLTDDDVLVPVADQLAAAARASDATSL